MCVCVSPPQASLVTLMSVMLIIDVDQLKRGRFIF